MKVGNVQMNSSKPSDAKFTVLSVADIVLLTASADVGETVPMPMPREQPSN
jgi:hypothetical protein